MITINLLPAEYRTAKRRGTTARPYIPIAILVAALLLLLTLFFYADFLKVKSSYERVRKEWIRFAPQMKHLKDLEQKVDVEMKGEKEFLESSILNSDPFTRVLQLVSERLPKGAWLTELKIERLKEGGNSVLLQGAVVPVGAKTGIEQIEEFVRTIKERFPKTTVALTTSKMSDKQVAGTAFTATITWGGKKS